MIFDTHAHYDDEAFDEDRDTLIPSLPANRIPHVVNIAATVDSQSRVLQLAQRYDFVYGALGVHPDDVGKMDDSTLEEIRRGLQDPKIVAVGEIGLDYYWDKENHPVQAKWFKAQIELALETNHPILVHSRDAAEDTMKILTQYYGKGGPAENTVRKGIIHCYSYSLEQAKLYTKMGFYLGIGGVVTFKNSKKLKQVVQEIPLQHLVLETDAPYLSPTPNRGKRNSSLNLPYVVDEIARLKNTTAEEVEQVTWDNAMDLFSLS